ncbi:MAG: transglycosylase domain-containing protein [Acidimicrobiales bacterium]
MIELLLQPRPPRNRRRNPLWRLRRVGLLAVLAFIGALAASVMVLSTQIQLPELATPDLSETTFICTSEVTGPCTRDVATATLSSEQDRELVTYDQIPPVLINAVIAAEDKDFFDHQGVDPYGIARALYQDIRFGGTLQGGSTITQQYVKNSFLTPDRTLARKIREATLAIKLEREAAGDKQSGKEQILNDYLNLIYFGRGAYGIQAASQAYFDKNVEELNLADAAYLAGLIRAPESADARDNPEEAKRRRSTVLRRMLEDGHITELEAERADKRTLNTIIPQVSRAGLGEVTGSEFGSEYFIEAVRQQLAQIYPDGGLYTQGLRVYTTLDHELQRHAYQTVVNELPPEDPDNPTASIVAIDDRGRVVAMMGGTDFGASEVNLATGRSGGGSGRQPGSSFKPFVLAESLEQGFSARSLYAAPSVIEIEGANDGGVWRVKGGGSSKGYRDLVDGLRVSSNVVYAQLMIDTRPDQVVQMAHKLGVVAELPPVNSLVLGAGEVSVQDMASAYSTFEREGVALAPVLIERIESSDGQVECWYPVEGVCQSGPERVGEQVIDPDIALQVNHALSLVVSDGTGRNAQIAQPAAGKTGTTQDARDAWFVGFTCDLTAAVWMGYPGGPGEPPRFMDEFRGIEVHGGDFPAEMWAEFMTRATEDSEIPCTELPTSDNFEGRVRNTNLSTTTTIPTCPAPGEEPLDPGIVECVPAPAPIETVPPTTAAPEG